MIETIDERGLLSLGLTRERVPDHWLEELRPEPGSGGHTMAGMRKESGERAGWMPQGPDLRDKLREALPNIIEQVTTIQQGSDWQLLNLIPRHDQNDDPDDWQYVGLTRVGDMLELWFAAEAWYRVRGGTLRMTHDIVIIRAPLTSAALKTAVVDREEWLAREPLVFELLPPKAKR